MTLTKRYLVERISGETGLIQTEVLDVVQKTLDYIAEALSQGDKVELRNFGVFDVKVRKPRVGRNPNRPETEVSIPSRAMVKFKAGKAMRAEVLKLSPHAPAELPPASPPRANRTDREPSQPAARPAPASAADADVPPSADQPPLAPPYSRHSARLDP